MKGNISIMHNGTKNKQSISKTMKKHNINVHTKDKSYKCRTCGKSFKYKLHLRRHERTYEDDKPYPCYLCDAAYFDKANLNNHKKVIHYDGLNFKFTVSYQCILCNKSFDDKETLYKHKDRMHFNDENYKCNMNVIKTKPNVRHHKNMIHHKKRHCEKMYQCKECLLFLYYRKIHRCRTYFCEVCRRVFSRKAMRDEHHFEHTNIKQYECLACNKGYMTKACLIAHIRNEGHISDSIVKNELQPTTKWVKYIYHYA